MSNVSRNDNQPEKCFYCGHYNAFHSGFIAESSNYGPCKKDSAHCGCWAFVASSDNNTKCKYCNHYSAFHQQKLNSNNTNNAIRPNNTLNLLSQIPTVLSISDMSNSSSSVANRQFLTPREEILANFQPQNTTSLLLNPRRFNNNRTTRLAIGRLKNISFQINHVLLFIDDSWRTMQPLVKIVENGTN